jgi:biopolymer transport protein ExbD
MSGVAGCTRSAALLLPSSFALLLLVACSQTTRLGAACDAGDPAACEDLSARYLMGDGVAEDLDRAAELDTRANDLCAKPENAANRACKVIVRSALAIPLDTPRALPPSGETQLVINVVVPAAGAILVDGVPAPDDNAFLARVRADAAKSPDARAVIKADASATHGRVIHVLDLLKQAGIGKIAFGVQPASAPPVLPAPPTPIPAGSVF